MMTKMNPVFVSGTNRSGTTLMYALLASHPNLSLVRRTDMWRYFYGQFGDLSRPENFERCLDAMLHYKRVANLQPDAERIRREFGQGEPTYGRLFALFHQHHAERAGKTRWGDKSLHTEEYADQIFNEYPQAKIIHIIRDPRDRYASVLKRLNAGSKRVGVDTVKWWYSARVARRQAQRYPGCFLTVRYETLAQQPEETLRRVCDFIGEPYTPQMLTMTGAPRYHKEGANTAFEQVKPGVISTRSIGRFRQVISRWEIAFIQTFARRLMAEFDYELEPVRLSAGERLAYLVALPLGLLRMVRWLALDKVSEMKGRPLREHRVLDDYREIGSVSETRPKHSRRIEPI
jgi:hypothetical protein